MRKNTWPGWFLNGFPGNLYALILTIKFDNCGKRFIFQLLRLEIR